MKKSNWKTNKGKFKGETGVWESENQRRPSPQERNTFSTDVVPERAILVSVCDAKTTMERTEECLKELAFLLETAGGIPVKTVIQKLDRPDSRTYIGSGKLEEVVEYKNALDADFVVFDDELSPAQLRNLEKAFNCRILDRTTLILDIFAKRARTSIAKTQVELAQLQYMLPRLTRLWTHLERQRGGIGMRGPGESQIETDRRLIGEKISLLKERLKDIEKQKVQQRKNRESLVRVALVGYTNVGKSTLMNLLSKSDVFAENKLFATLDTTVRKVVIGNVPFLLSDTVGFIRKLPTQLIEAFKSTLDEVREADILVHVVDISHPDYEEQMEVVDKTLKDISAADKPVYVVFNKTDAYTYEPYDEFSLEPKTEKNFTLDEVKYKWINGRKIPCIFISAIKKENIEKLRDDIYKMVAEIHAGRYPFNNFLW